MEALETWQEVRRAIRMLETVEEGLVANRRKLLVEPALDSLARAKAAAEDLLVELRALRARPEAAPVGLALQARRAQHRAKLDLDRLEAFREDKAEAERQARAEGRRPPEVRVGRRWAARAEAAPGE